MINDKTLANRLRRHRKLKALTEAHLELAVSDQDKKHLKARIAEIDRDIVATKGDNVEEGDAPPIPAAVEYIESEKKKAESKALLPAITETAEEDVKKLEEPPKRIRKKNIGNPF